MIFLNRFFKFLMLFVVAYFLLFVVGMYFFADSDLGISFLDYLKNRLQTPQLLIILGFALIYPFLGFGKIKFYINGSWEDNKEWIDSVITNCGFEEISFQNSTIIYQKKNRFIRAVNLGEDVLKVQIDDSPIIISGMRKELKKLKQQLDFAKKMK